MVTLAETRQRFARTLAGYEARGVLTAAGQRTTTADGTVSTLVEARWPLLSPRVARTYALDGAYLLRPTADPSDRLRLVMAGGLNSQTGQITNDADWLNPPVADEAYELHTHGIEPVAELTDLFNTALKMIYLIVDVAFTPATDAKGAYVPQLDLDGNALAGWLVDEGQLLRLRTTAAFAGMSGVLNAPEAWSGDLRGAARRDGDRLYLTGNGLFPTATVYATAKKPAYWHCRTSAVATAYSAGLTPGSEAGVSPVDEDWLVDAALVAGWERAPYALETAAQRRRDQYLQEASARFEQRQQAYWQANPVLRTFVPAARTVVVGGS